MSTFTIEWLERKTTSAGEKYNATLKEVGSGAQTENVTIWNTYPNFQGLVPGATVYGDLVPAKDPKYGPSLYAPKPAPTGTTRGAGGGRNMERLMDKKEATVEKNMDRKDESVRISATSRDAVLIATSRGIAGWEREDVEAEIVYWREWLWKRWSDPEQYPPF